MNTQDVIDSYVGDVAALLPRKQRNDVAFELRHLLTEQLADRAEATGRPADAAMTIDMLREFGRPEQVAGRYRVPFDVVDPLDAESFVRASWIGMLVIWVAHLISAYGRPLAEGDSLLRALGEASMQGFMGSFWWPGVLVVCFGTSASLRRKKPLVADWSPRDPSRIGGGRAGLVLAIVGIGCGLWLLAQPTWILDFFWNGRAAPQAYGALTYAESFLSLQGPILFGLIALYIPLYFAVLMKGQWTPLLRHLETGLGVLGNGAMIWTIAAGPVLITEHGDRTARGSLLLIVVITSLILAYQAWNAIRPAPSTWVPSR